MQMRLMQPEPVDAPELRPYQTEAVEAIRRELSEHRATLALLATGLGKTQIACEIIRTHPGRACFLAHRNELITQAANRLEQFTGEPPAIEKAQDRASRYDTRHVVASVQTLSQRKRLEGWPRDAFDLLVVDEVHHAVADTYRRVMDWFEGAKVLGLTATPDRADKEALGQVVDSVAYRYEITDAIGDGWLCPVRIKAIGVDSVDFSQIHTLAGDFNQAELDALMAREENLHAVAKPTVELSGDRQTIVFTTSVANAHRLAEIINRYSGGESARAVDGKTPAQERNEIMGDFAAGEFQYLVNVGIATEGYDCPPVACIVMGRPTKSRALYVQMMGRGTRGGVNWPVPGKSDLLVLDFKGNSGRHDVVSGVDVLGGNLSDGQIEAAKAEVEASEDGITVEEAVELARQRYNDKREREIIEADERRKVTAEVDYREIDPQDRAYGLLGIERDRVYERFGFDPATPKQIAALRKMLGKYADQELPKALSKSEATAMIKRLISRRELGLCTYSQMRLLQKRGVEDAKVVTFESARRVIDALAGNRWRWASWMDRMILRVMEWPI